MTGWFQRRRGSVCTAFTSLWLLSGLLLAGVNEWTPAGPPGEPVASFAVDPGNSARLYAGTADLTLSGRRVGVFRSADRRQTWQFTELGSPGITGLGVDPRAPSVVYAVSFTGALFRSEDFGAAWVRSPLSESDQIRSITPDPSNPGSFYAAVGHFLFVFKGDSICRSDDGFRTRNRCAGFADGSRVTSIAVDPAAPSRVYASIDDGSRRAPTLAFTGPRSRICRRADTATSPSARPSRRSCTRTASSAAPRRRRRGPFSELRRYHRESFCRILSRPPRSMSAASEAYRERPTAEGAGPPSLEALRPGRPACWSSTRPIPAPCTPSPQALSSASPSRTEALRADPALRRCVSGMPVSR